VTALRASAVRRRILFVAARFPYPVLKGDQVRAYHQLRLLGARHDITLVAFADRPVSAEERAHVAQFCRAVVIVPIRRIDMALALVRHCLSPLPLQTLVYQTPAMAAALREQLALGFDLVHVQLARMAEHAIGSGTPCVVDLIDALSLNMTRRASEKRGVPAAIAALEARRMRGYERRLCETVSQLSVVSPIDRSAIGSYASLAVNGNGVDLDRFAFTRRGRRRNALVFSGNMRYFPNVNAVGWFAREVFPLIQRVIPEATFTIVGTNPAREVSALAGGGITVTGHVADLRPYLTQATAAVVPMRAGTGMQNKVIEAMACGTPIVATGYALGGIGAEDGRHVLIGTDPTHFALQTIRLLREPALRDRIAHEARLLVERDHSWERSVRDLEELYERAVLG